MKKFIILLCSAALIFCGAAVARAIPISGELLLIDWSWISPIDTETATYLPGAESFALGSGDLADLSRTFITTNGFSFNPALTPAADPLWTVGDFSFILDTVVITLQDADMLALSGFGRLSNSDLTLGLEDAIYSWGLGVLPLGKASLALQFHSPAPTTPSPQPEPATMLLLGTGLAGMVAMVRRRKVRKA